MEFKIKNISNVNHRIEMRGHAEMFNNNGPMIGDVYISPTGDTLEACLTPLAGPSISCAGSLPIVEFDVTNAFNGFLYLNGVEYELNGLGNTFLDKFNQLVSQYPEVGDAMFVGPSGEDPNQIIFVAQQNISMRVAIVANSGETVDWHQKPSETLKNTTVDITDNQVSFCLMPNIEHNVYQPNPIIVNRADSVSLELYADERYQLSDQNTILTVNDGDVTIGEVSYSENYASWQITANSPGPVEVMLWCAYLTNEYQAFEFEAIEPPTMVLNTPKIFDWNIRGRSASLANVTQSFSDGGIVQANQMTYVSNSKVTLPPFYDKAVNVSSGKVVDFSAPGMCELVGRAYHPSLGQYVDSAPVPINVFGFENGINLGSLEPGSTKSVLMKLTGIATLPEGWTTQLRLLSPLNTDISEMVKWSIDPANPLLIHLDVIGGFYTNAIQLAFEYVDPDGVAATYTQVDFRINTNFMGKQSIFVTYPEDDIARKEIDVFGIVYGAKALGNVTIKAFDFEMDIEPVNTYTTTMDAKGHFNFRLPENAFSVGARRPTLGIQSEAWEGSTVSTTHYAKPRLPLIVKCERNVPLRLDPTTANRVTMYMTIDDEKTIYPTSNEVLPIDLSSDKQDLATIKFYAHSPWKGSSNLGARFYRLKDETLSDADTVNPSIREIVQWGNVLDTSEVATLRFDSISGLITVPDNIPTEWQSTDSLFTGCKDLNDPKIATWKVGNIKTMKNMFNKCSAFNQDLSGWCVTNVSSLPTNFATDSALTPEHNPVWGTCPNG